MLFKNIIKKIKNYDELELNYAYLSSDYNNLEEKYINLKKLYETLEEENILLEKRRRSNAGAVGGLIATNNKLRKQIKLLTNDLAYAIKIIKELNKENQKLKNPTTMQQIYEYERTRKAPKSVSNKKNILPSKLTKKDKKKLEAMMPQLLEEDIKIK